MPLRRSEIINTRTRIGHTNLAHIHIIKNEEQPVSQCNELLSSQHIGFFLDICQRKTILNQPS